MQNRVIQVLVIVLGCFAAVGSSVFIFSGDTNSLGTACLLGMFISFVIAVAEPRAGLVLLLLYSGYLDLIKRLLVFWGGFGYLDLAYVLGLAPVTVAGLVVGIFLGHALQKFEIPRGTFALVLFAAILNCFIAAYLLKAGSGGMDTLRDVANNGAYIFMLPAAYCFLNTPKAIATFAKLAVLIFIPVALYGIYQSIFGFARFEEEYLKSGLTIMVKELDDVLPRPFSTLNSSGSLATMLAGMTILSLAIYDLKGGQFGKSSGRFGYLALATIFIIACFMTYTRSGLGILGIGLLSWFCFLGKLRTVLLYSMVVIGFVSLILSANWLLHNLHLFDVSSEVQSERGGQLVRIYTYSERLKGFVNLTATTDMWSPFGLLESSKMTSTTYNHDGFSQMLVTFGYIPTTAMIATFGFVLFRIHRALFRVPNIRQRKFLAALTSIVLAWVAAEILVSFVIGVFPLNFFLWTLAGAVMGNLFANPDRVAAGVTTGVHLPHSIPAPHATYSD